MSDEQRERLLIAEQIERAKVEEEEQGASGSGSSESPPPVEEGLKREEGAEKVVLSLSAKPVVTTATMPSFGLKPNTNPLKANPLKRPNVLKTAVSSPAPSTSTSSGTKRPAPLQSAAERLIFEDQERKRRRMERETA